MYPPRQGQGIWDNQQVISRPEVHSIELTPADSFLILASDGLWGVLSNQQAVSFVHRRLLTHRDVQRAAVELIDKVIFVKRLYRGSSPCEIEDGLRSMATSQVLLQT